MKKTPLIAMRRMMYMTRRLQAGDSFLARPGEARILKDQGKARDDFDAPVKAALAQAKAAPEPESDDPALVDMDALRRDAEALGIKVDRRWGELRLRDEMDAAVAAMAAQAQMDPEPEAPIEGEANTTPAMTTTSAGALMPHGWLQDEE